MTYTVTSAQDYINQLNNGASTADLDSSGLSQADRLILAQAVDNIAQLGMSPDQAYSIASGSTTPGQQVFDSNGTMTIIGGGLLGGATAPTTPATTSPSPDPSSGLLGGGYNASGYTSPGLNQPIQQPPSMQQLQQKDVAQTQLKNGYTNQAGIGKDFYQQRTQSQRLAPWLRK